MLQGQAHGDAFFVFLDCITLIYIKYSKVNQVWTCTTGHQLLILTRRDAGINDKSQVTADLGEARKLLHGRYLRLLQSIHGNFEEVDASVNVQLALQCRVESTDETYCLSIRLKHRRLPLMQSGVLS